MKRGDLITVDVPGTNVLGILLELLRENEWGDQKYRFWKILTQEGRVIEEFESYIMLMRSF